jgi:hypothetical protein
MAGLVNGDERHGRAAASAPPARSRIATDAGSSGRERLLWLQRTVGNRATLALLTTPAPVRPAAQVVQRVDLTKVSAKQKGDLVTAYRTDAKSGGMWGRESDLEAMARGLGLRITVLDFSADPGSQSTDVSYSYGTGREIFLKYSGAHYDVLAPSGGGVFRLRNATAGTVTRYRMDFPVTGDGNCMFAAVWYAGYREASTVFGLVNPGAVLPTRLRVDLGQRLLRDFCHGEGGMVSDAEVERELTAMDGANLSDEHIGPTLATLLDTVGLSPKKPAPRDLRGESPAKSGSELTAKQAKEAFKGFTNAPDYWAELKWTMVGSDIYQADLPPDHKLFADIEKSVTGGIEKRPYKSAAGEHTRMEVVRGNIAWLNDKAKKGKLSDQEKQQLAAATQRLNEGQKGGPEAPRSRQVEIDHIVVIANQKLWNAYQAAASSVRQDLTAKKNKDPMKKIKFDGTREAQLLDNAIAEVRLFHSTSASTMDILVKGGFNPAYSANKAKPGEQARYGPLGQGSYFADVISKAMTYSQCPVCSDYDCATHKDEVSQTLLTRVVLGNTKKAHSFVQSGLKMKDLRADDLGKLKADRHTVYSEGFAGSKNALTAGSGLNEYGVKDASLTYPEFRIFYKTKR